MRANFLLPVIVIFGLTLSGCSSLPERDTVANTSSEWLARSGEAISAQSQRLADWFGSAGDEDEALAKELAAQRQALFDQPYIDPLTRYLEEHAEDLNHTEGLVEVSRERDRRCAAIAGDYAERPATRETLAHYRRGYLYSCPAEVNAFYARVREQEAQRAAALPAPVAIDRVDTPAEPPLVEAQDTQVVAAVERRQLNDCYLLFTIRNLGEAREACRGPAEQGDSRAQRYMGGMAELAGEHEKALRWYRRAADNGDTQAGERLEALSLSSQDIDTKAAQ